MKKHQLKKLSAFIVTAMMFSASANAQIVYTDIVPDDSMSCKTYFQFQLPCNSMDSIDLNNDGVFDLKLSVFTKVSGSGLLLNPSGVVGASPLNGSEIRTGSSGYPLKMNLNDIIDSSGSWSKTADSILLYKYQAQFSSTTLGNWITVTDGFLGLKIISGSQTNYCWIRLNVSVVLVNPTFAFFTLKDFAYNSIPNQPILAGQTVATGVHENSRASSINLLPNPATNNVTINLGTDTRSVHLSIADITGKIIYTTIARNIQKIEVNTQDFAAGIYVVQIQSADFIGTKKLVIEK